MGTVYKLEEYVGYGCDLNYDKTKYSTDRQALIDSVVSKLSPDSFYCEFRSSGYYIYPKGGMGDHWVVSPAVNEGQWYNG